MTLAAEPKPAPACPECGARLKVLREYLFAPWIALCEHGHLCDAWFDHDADEWKARLADDPVVSDT